MPHKVNEYFEQVSSEWDILRRAFYGEEVREAVLKAAEVNSNDIVLDVGAGTGFLTEGAAKVARKVIGLDLSEAMTEKAIPKLKGKNVEFKIGDVQKILLENSSVQVVMGNMILHHCPRPRDAIKEMVRVLAPGGRLVLSDLTEHSHELLRNEHADLWLGFNTSNVRQMFEDAGLQKVTVEKLGSCCSSELKGEQVKIPMFLAKGLKI